MINGLAVFRPGYGWYPLAVGEKVILAHGDVLQVGITVPYKGPAQDFTLYGSIGTRGALGFDEILVGKGALSCPDSPATSIPVEGIVDIPITVAQFVGIGGISPGIDYDLYVKIEQKPDVMDEVDDCIDIVGGGGLPDWMGMLMEMMPMVMLMMGMAMVVPLVTGGG